MTEFAVRRRLAAKLPSVAPELSSSSCSASAALCHDLPSCRLRGAGLDLCGRLAKSGVLLVLLLVVGRPWVVSAEPIAVSSSGGMVVTVSPEASDAGVAIMRRGGNAVDAAVATAFALAVTFPEAGNIGGGGFMMIHGPEMAEPVCVDYRETAPAAATPDMFAEDDRVLGHKTVGVPGTVRGLALAHARYGKLGWSELLAPAIVLADEGFAIDAALAQALNELNKELPAGDEFVRVYGKADGLPWAAGDRLVQKDLAATLREIAEAGPDAFYTGNVAKQLVAEMQAGGGLITLADLAAYRAIERRPIHGTFRGYDIYGPPPPSSGGTVLVQVLNTLENFELGPANRLSEPRTLHLVVESVRRAYCDRARYLGDPAFIQMPEHLTSKEYARRLAIGICPERATPSEALAPEVPLAAEGESTTHFSVADAQGMVVSNTYTLQDSYGARVVVRGAGFLLNNEMTDFNPRPGHTDRTGRIGTPANLVAPGKRMLSSQCPVIVLRDKRPVLVTGSPGGRTIPNTVLGMVLNVLAFEMPLEEAMAARRFHHAWFPDELRLEQSDAEDCRPLVEQLKAMGYRLSPIVRPQGDAHSILIQADRKIGVADDRRTQGKAAAYELPGGP